jgi:hypothetical protein
LSAGTVELRDLSAVVIIGKGPRDLQRTLPTRSWITVIVGNVCRIATWLGEIVRNAVWRAICAVGGLASLDGSCLWHVIGGECDLARWALEQGWIGRRISVDAAQGILISTLASVKEHDL